MPVIRKLSRQFALPMIEPWTTESILTLIQDYDHPTFRDQIEEIEESKEEMIEESV